MNKIEFKYEIISTSIILIPTILIGWDDWCFSFEIAFLIFLAGMEIERRRA
jgi:hypothetical protein